MSSESKIYKIGTRGSLLALTQCEQTKWELEKLTGNSFELVTIKTQGDENTSVPLWQLDGKDFFTKELDQALLTKKVDLVVHSYKDLGSDRPQGITLAAITERKFPHDILLIKNETIAKLANLKSFVVGTSSPRRIENITSSLSRVIPGQADIETKMLRGNVNSRIQKLKDGEYDAIVLALAGLERLATHPESKTKLADLLTGLNYMVMPLTSFPSAAAQGALAIECREDDLELKEKLATMNHQTTIEEVGKERALFQEYGGGCHLAVGINVQKKDDLFITCQKGKVDDQVINKTSLSRDLSRPTSNKAFVGLPAEKIETSYFSGDEIYNKDIKTASDYKTDKKAVFVTSSYCLAQAKKIQNGSYFASGSRTMEKLATEGLWVNGSADGLGENELKRLQSCETLKHMTPELADTWVVLSHDKSDTTLGEIISCYEHIKTTPSQKYVEKLQALDIFFWTSFGEYEHHLEHIPNLKNKTHCCGIGKTYNKFKQENIKVLPFTGMAEFKRWLNKDSQ